MPVSGMITRGHDSLLWRSVKLNGFNGALFEAHIVVACGEARRYSTPPTFHLTSHQAIGAKMSCQVERLAKLRSAASE